MVREGRSEVEVTRLGKGDNAVGKLEQSWDGEINTY